MAPSFDKSGIIEFFLVEAGEHIQNLNRGLLSLEKNPSDNAMIDELFRAAHTLKGSAAMMGFQGISDVAHKAEDMLGHFRNGSVPIQRETLNFLFDSVDAVKLMVDGVAAGRPEDPLVVDSIVQSYGDIVEHKPVEDEELPSVLPGVAPVPQESVSPPSASKDELDRAWEETFGLFEEEAISVEPLPDDREMQKTGLPSPDDKEPSVFEVPSAGEEAAPAEETAPSGDEEISIFNLSPDAAETTPAADTPPVLAEEISIFDNPPAGAGTTSTGESAPAGAEEISIFDLSSAGEETPPADETPLIEAEVLPAEEVESPVEAAVEPESVLPAEAIEPPAPTNEEPSEAIVPEEAEAPPEAASASLKQEIEESKKTGIQEKRGFGRRASDAAEIEKQFIRVNIERLDNLMNLVGEMIVNRNRLARQVDFIRTLREELAFSQDRLLREIRQFEEKYEYTLNYGAPAPQADAPGATDFMDLEFDRYDDFNLLSRKLTEITNDTNEIMMELAGFFDSFELDTARIATITTNLQDEITLARMVEVDRLFQMFHRPVRDLSLEEHKQVNMVVSGGDTKIDKTIFEIISDPLMHMVRNAISHGIEPAEERKRLGKEAVGSLILKARHEGNSIILEIEDDGHGMDPEKIRTVALEKGFINSAEAQGLSDMEALNLIFRPGFSTASTISRVSGRGVGMDVVSSQLSKINGRIEIKTEKGVGTRFIIRLPLTLAIAQALIVKLKDQELAVPMNLVEETTRFSFKDIQRAAGEEMVNLRGTLIRLVKLNDLLGVGKFPRKEETFRHPTLVLSMAEKKIALMVEDITGREEIVVKSLGDYLRSIRMFSGATISGEGNVRLILNVASMFGDDAGTVTKASFSFAKEGTAPPEPLETTVQRKPTVLVVDDSISIRKYVQRFLDRTGYIVETASDGMEALNTMGRIKFDAVITDLEMPVMHGYDLIAEMKRSSALSNIPVIVLTSRAGEKHRQKAIEMGAQDYLVKPFEEEEMLTALKKLLSGAALAHRA